MRVHLRKEFKFEASHQLPNHDGKCARLHGHSWVLQVRVVGEIQKGKGPKEGMVIDYSEIKGVIQPIIEALDHQHLGTGRQLNPGATLGFGPLIEADSHLLDMNFPTVPTSENILVWIADQLPPEFNWSCLSLNETCTSEAKLYRDEYELGWESEHGIK